MSKAWAGGSTTARRGYGHTHRLTRAAYLPAAYGTACARCGEAMTEGQDLDLDHTDDRSTYLGFSHSACNRAAGARNSLAKRHLDPLGNRSRDW